MKNSILLLSLLLATAPRLAHAAEPEVIADLRDESVYLGGIGGALHCDHIDTNGDGINDTSLVKFDLVATHGGVGVLQKTDIEERVPDTTGATCAVVRELVQSSNHRFGFLPVRQDTRVVKIGARLEETLAMTIFGVEPSHAKLTLHSRTVRELSEQTPSDGGLVVATNIEPIRLAAVAEHLYCTNIDTNGDKFADVAEIELLDSVWPILPGLLENSRVLERRADKHGTTCEGVERLVESARMTFGSLSGEQRSVLRRIDEHTLEEELEIRLDAPASSGSTESLTLRARVQRRI